MPFWAILTAAFAVWCAVVWAIAALAGFNQLENDEQPPTRTTSHVTAHHNQTPYDWQKERAL